MNVQVLSPGLQTTVQDSGRLGHRHLGVSRAGALDADAAVLANRLVGNYHDDAVLEIALQGPTLRFDAPTRIALVGAAFAMRLDDIELANGRPLTLPSGTLHIGRAHGGARAWLAIAGGFAVQPVLGSRSTDLRGGFGGFDGRALRKGDALPLGDAAIDLVLVNAPGAPRIPPWWIDPSADEPPDAPLRYVPSAHDASELLHKAHWRVDPRSDRQGVRLDGEPLRTDARNLVSAPVAPGTIQLPPDGRPIVLLNDAQTAGGYPVLGYIIGRDLPRLAQLGPHARVRFEACDRPQAWRLAQEARARHARLLVAIDERLRG